VRACAPAGLQSAAAAATCPLICQSSHFGRARLEAVYRSSGYYHAHYTGMCLQSAWFRRQYPSSCQISWQSVKPLLSYGDLSICSKLRMSTIVTVARALNYRRGVFVGFHRFANFG